MCCFYININEFFFFITLVSFPGIYFTIPIPPSKNIAEDAVRFSTHPAYGSLLAAPIIDGLTMVTVRLGLNVSLFLSMILSTAALVKT